MNKKRLIGSLALTLVFDGMLAQETQWKPSVSVTQAIEKVGSPARGFGNMGPFELQTHYRLRELQNYETGFRYDFKEADGPAWRALMTNETASVYARLCAAYFLLDNDEDARVFVKSRIESKNLRHRYNAAELLHTFVARNPTTPWGVDLLIEQIANGSLDGSGMTSSPSGEFPEGDRDDILSPPLDKICWLMGQRKESKAASPLIALLQRRKFMMEAADALGDIGDPRAGAIVFEAAIREGVVHYPSVAVVALGKLKYEPAVPVLIAMLVIRPESDVPEDPTFGDTNKRRILDALLQIGDPEAIPGIQSYLDDDIPNEMRSAARRVLVQLQEKEPVVTLLLQLDREPEETEKGRIIEDLAKHKDPTVIARLAQMARESDSAFLRREAINGLRQIANRRALLELAALLKLDFPIDLKADRGWKVRPDFSKFFPELLVTCLKEKTGQDFGTDSAKWKAWIEENVKE